MTTYTEEACPDAPDCYDLYHKHFIEWDKNRQNTKSQTDNTELDEIKKTVWECIRYNKFNLSDTEAVGVIMQAVEAKLQEQDIKSRIDELGNVQLDYGRQTARVWVDGKIIGILERLDQLRSLL